MDPRWDPRWSSDGSDGSEWIRDGIPDGAQMETKGFKIESQMELSWNSTGSEGIRDGIPDGAQMEAKEAKEAKMELRWKQSKQRKPRWNPRWSSDGSEGIRDGIPDGAQTEAKGFKMESQMELSWKPRNSRLTPNIESK